MFRIAWRLQRMGLIGMTGFGVFYGLLQAAGYASAAGNTPAARVAFGHEMETFGRTFTFLLPLPLRLDTVSGYVQWRIYGGLVMLFAVWALMSAVGATRADEDRGLIEQWLTSPLGRGRYVATRFVAFALALVIAIAATSAGIDGTVSLSHFALDPGKVLEESLVLAACTLCCYALVLGVAQFTSRRATATGVAGAVLAAMFLLNGMSRTDARLTPVARLVSPFYYADRSMPLTPGRTFDTGATAGLLVAALVLAGLAAWLMGYRDIGSPLFQRRQNRQAVTYVPARTPWLRIPVLAPLYEQRFTLLAWATGVAISAAYIASIGRTLVNLVKEPGELHAYLALAGRGDPYVAITGYFWFGMLQLMLVAFALASVARWAGEDNDGRLEMQLSAPVPRWRVVVERSVSFLAGAAAIVLLSSAAFYVSGLAGNISFNAGDLAVASLLLLPFVLSFAALGALWTSRAPRTAIAALATVAFLSYLITAGGPLLKWPDWVMKLSAFSLYGTPLTSGAYWAGLWILLAVTLGGFGLAAVLMERREVGR